MIQNIIKLFEEYQLYFVGGYNRDKILGIESNDVDFSTNLKPEQIMSIAESNDTKIRYTTNSLKHGTVIIDEFEITTFRKDVSCDGRNAKCRFAETIEEDLSRRDFTINSIAVNAFTGEFVDPFGGIQDIKNKIIRAVGNPEDRLREDTLRALRAIRFANRFNFIIESDLLDAINNTDISNLSVERVRDEFMKILETRNDNYIVLILHKVIPEFGILDNLDGGDKHAETVDVHSLLTMRHMMEASYKPLNIFVGLIHDIGKGFTKDDPDRMFSKHEDVGADKAKEIMKRMKFSNEEINYSYNLIKNHMRWHFLDSVSPTDRTIRRAIRDLPDNVDKEEMITDLSILTWADCQANLLNKSESFEDYTERRGIYKRALEILHKQPEVKVGSGLEINGNDLIEMRFKPSPLFNTILKDVEEKVFNDEIKNINEELRKYVMEKYGN